MQSFRKLFCHSVWEKNTFMLLEFLWGFMYAVACEMPSLLQQIEKFLYQFSLFRQDSRLKHGYIFQDVYQQPRKRQISVEPT